MDRHGINNVLSGGNWVTEGILPTSWVYDQNDDKNIRDIHKRFGTVPLKQLKFLGMLRKTWRLKMGGIKIYRNIGKADNGIYSGNY